jgi:hypothetical protein
MIRGLSQVMLCWVIALGQLVLAQSPAIQPTTSLTSVLRRAIYAPSPPKEQLAARIWKGLAPTARGRQICAGYPSARWR